MRLAQGMTTLEGRVEICRSNRWGTICDNNWDRNDAKVVCRQLGYSSAGTYIYSLPPCTNFHYFFLLSILGAYPTYSASFGEGRGAILLNMLACTGDETMIANCTSGSLDQCTHSEDAGVRCLLQTSK